MDTKELTELDELIQRMATVSMSSPIYEKIANYIEKDYLKIIFMTASETATELCISQGSVSRFCSALGYHGYNDFLRDLQKLVSKKLTVPQRLQFMSAYGDNRVGNIVGIEIQNMCQLDSIMQGEAYEKLLDTIVSADDLFLISARMSATLLPYMGYIMKKMRNSVYEVVPETPDWDMLEYRDPQKTKFIVLAFPRYPRVLLEKLKILKDRGFSFSAITDSRFSPVVPLAETSVIVPITVSSIFDIYSTPMAFINLLLRDATKRMKSLDKRLELIEQSEKEHGAYYT